MNRSHNGEAHGSGESWREAHESLDTRLERAAERHARGAMSAQECAAYIAHLEHCDVCSALVLEQRHVDATGAAVLERSAPAPGADVWDAIEEHISRSGARDGSGALQSRRPEAREVQTWKSWNSVEGTDLGGAGLSLVALDSSDFEPTAIAGIRTRRLSVDREARRVSMLVRMEPGTSYPPHRHGGAEECYVVAGDLRVGDVRMRAGDFQRAEKGSIHPVQVTDGGCLLLITSSMDDDLLES